MLQQVKGWEGKLRPFRRAFPARRNGFEAPIAGSLVPGAAGDAAVVDAHVAFPVAANLVPRALVLMNVAVHGLRLRTAGSVPGASGAKLTFILPDIAVLALDLSRILANVLACAGRRLAPFGGLSRSSSVHGKRSECGGVGQRKRDDGVNPSEARGVGLPAGRTRRAEESCRGDYTVLIWSTGCVG